MYPARKLVGMSNGGKKKSRERDHLYRPQPVGSTFCAVLSNFSISAFSLQEDLPKKDIVRPWATCETP
jgi:hypothetical protein